MTEDGRRQSFNWATTRGTAEMLVAERRTTGDGRQRLCWLLNGGPERRCRSAARCWKMELLLDAASPAHYYDDRTTEYGGRWSFKAQRLCGERR
ncbi:hypothetical protein SESBI_05860 [Sesbania bispinosa]|nr:hypothetical protein SESBI_05860 [Sesbania bispinosa]